jgi:hypothetical protein
VVGVLPPDVSMPHPSGNQPADVWYILSSDLKHKRPRSADMFFALGRLRPDVTVAQPAIRAALGAGRWRLRGEVAAEQCLRTLLSLGPGVALAPALLRTLARLVPAAGLGPPC